MLRKTLTLLVVGGLLAWTAAGQAAQVNFDTVYYAASVDALNTLPFPNVGIYDSHDGAAPVSAYATYLNATAYASAGLDGHTLYAETGETGDNRIAEAASTYMVSFAAPATGKVTISFNYALSVSTTGDAGSLAQISLDIYDPQNNDIGGKDGKPAIDPYGELPSPYHIEVSSSGNPGDESAADSSSGTFSQVLNMQPGQEYSIDLELWWVYAEGYDGTAAYTTAAIDGFSVDDGTAVTPPPPDPVPVPSTFMLLGSGLVGLLGWGRARLG